MGPVEVQARLRFRAFPPKILRLLSKEAPDLVTEEMVDKNTIVDMAQDFAYIQNTLRKLFNRHGRTFFVCVRCICRAIQAY